MSRINRVLVGSIAFALSSCSGTSVHSHSTPTSTSAISSTAYPRCPARFPKLGVTNRDEHVLVPVGATALVDCGYEYPRIPSGPTKPLNPGPAECTLVGAEGGRDVLDHPFVLQGLLDPA
jgi:hypothetical protein